MSIRTKRPSWFAYPGIGFVFVLMISILQQEVSGQNMILQIGGNQTQMYEQLMSIFDQQKERSAHRIHVQVDDIHNACTLTESQRKKLTIAAKGAVESHSKKIADQLKKAASSMAQFEFSPGNPPKREKGEDEKDQALNIIGGRMVTLSAASDGSVEASKIWTAAVLTTLTTQQLKQLNDWDALRLQRVRESAVTQYVTRVDEKLFLSPEQLAKVTNWVDSNIGEQLAAQMKSGQRVRPAFIAGNGIGGPLEVAINAEIKDLLTSTQQDIWKSEFQQSFEKLQNVNGVGAINR